jgi:hypothetical protein
MRRAGERVRMNILLCGGEFKPLLFGGAFLLGVVMWLNLLKGGGGW